MKLINDIDLEEFADESGDKLYCLPSPRRVDVVKRDGLYLQAATSVTLDDEDEESPKLKGINLSDLDIVKFGEHRFTSVVVKMELGGEIFSGKLDLLRVYRQLDPVSGKWVDDTVDSIWERLDADEEKKELPTDLPSSPSQVSPQAS